MQSNYSLSQKGCEDRKNTGTEDALMPLFFLSLSLSTSIYVQQIYNFDTSFLAVNNGLE